jgi:hypothetical protein
MPTEDFLVVRSVRFGNPNDPVFGPAIETVKESLSLFHAADYAPAERAGKTIHRFFSTERWSRRRERAVCPLTFLLLRSPRPDSEPLAIGIDEFHLRGLEHVADSLIIDPGGALSQ